MVAGFCLHISIAIVAPALHPLFDLVLHVSPDCFGLLNCICFISMLFEQLAPCILGHLSFLLSFNSLL